MQKLPIEKAIQIARQHRQAGRWREAEEICRRVLERQPKNVAALVLLGSALQSSGKFKAAIACYRKLTQLRPNDPLTHYNLGVTLQVQGLLDEAIAMYQKAIQLNPDFPPAHNNLGLALDKKGQHEEAIAHHKKAIELKPNFPEAHNNLGVLLKERGRFEEALACFQKAIQLNSPEAHSNLGFTLMKLGRVEEAISHCDKAIQLKPDFAEAHLNKAIALLLSGIFEEGWTEYEWRWRRKDVALKKPAFLQPQWDGSDLSGRTILLYAEQGFGDALQFARYAPLVAKRGHVSRVGHGNVASRGGRVILECQPELKSLFADLQGVEKVVAKGEQLPDFDVQSPLLSLPLAFGTTLQTIPAGVPYLRADPKKVEHWHQRLTNSINIEHSSSSPSRHGGQASALRVGLVWEGRPKPDPNRSCPWKTFASLAQVRGVAFYSLQKGEAAKEAKDRPSEMIFIDWTNDLNDFADTAALVANLDLVISIDTSVVHLAGALAKPVWTLRPFATDWHWLLQREDSPWYPTMRLFRQPRAGDWNSVIKRVAEELSILVKRSKYKEPE